MNHLPQKILDEANTAALCTLALSFFQKILSGIIMTLRALKTPTKETVKTSGEAGGLIKP